MSKIKQSLRHRYINALDTYFTAIYWAGIPLIVLYFSVIFAWVPIYHGGCWEKILETWYRWQSFSAGMLAFTASIIVFNISKRIAEEQRARDFLAARAFLPETIYGFSDHCRGAIEFFAKCWLLGTGRANIEEVGEIADQSWARLPKISESQIPESYREVFKACLSAVAPDVSEGLSRRLSRILWEIQSTDSWVTIFSEHILYEKRLPTSTYGESSLDLIFNNLYRAAKTRVLLMKTIRFARGEEDLDETPPVWEDFKQALVERARVYNGMSIDKFPGLEKEFKKRMEKDAEES